MYTKGRSRRRALRRPRSLQDACSSLGLQGLGPALTSPRKAAHSTTVVNQRSTLWPRPSRTEATASDSFSAPGPAGRSRCPPAPPSSSSSSSVAAASTCRAPCTGSPVPPRPRAPAPTPGTGSRERAPGAKPSHRAGAGPPGGGAPARPEVRPLTNQEAA